MQACNYVVDFGSVFHTEWWSRIRISWSWNGGKHAQTWVRKQVLDVIFRYQRKLLAMSWRWNFLALLLLQPGDEFAVLGFGNTWSGQGILRLNVHKGWLQIKKICKRDHTCLAASLHVSHSKTSNGETFLWARTTLEVLLGCFGASEVVPSDGPLMFRVTIWWEEAKEPTAHEKSPDGTMVLLLTVSDLEMRKYFWNTNVAYEQSKQKIGQK